jgi:hypothetical protein
MTPIFIINMTVFWEVKRYIWQMVARELAKHAASISTDDTARLSIS